MTTFTDIKPLQDRLHEIRHMGNKVGFVPTMGALHKGHLQLIQQALAENDVVVCSIYVNPTQFNNAADLSKYPRDLEADVALLQQEGCDVIFSPSDLVMYPNGQHNTLTLNFGDLEYRLEGKFRPGHFSGVGLVVSKLFHIVMPDRVYFGQKDLQQVAVIRKLVDHLFFNVEVIKVPTVRAKSGLALSSRNALLSEDGRKKASHLFYALNHARQYLRQHPDSVSQAKEQALALLQEEPAITLEYLEVVNAASFDVVTHIQRHQEIAVCIAAFVEGIRLIDNVLL